MASKLKVDELAGSSSSTIALASGQTLDTSSGTLTLATASVTSAQLAGSVANAKLANSSITIGDESSNVFDISLGDEFSIIGGEGIDTTLTGNLLTVAGEDATTSNKGVASFHGDNFAVSSGAVTIKNGGVANAELANSSITVTDGSTTTATALGGTITFAAGEGMDVGESSGTITFSGEDASTSNKGVASFSSDNFAASSGAITIKDAGVALAEIANAAANTVIVRDANSSGVLSAKAVTNTQILIGDGTGFTAAALSGDVTMTNAGAVTIANDSVEEAMMADDAIGSAQLKSLVTINILASDGSTVVKTIFTPGS